MESVAADSVLALASPSYERGRETLPEAPGYLLHLVCAAGIRAVEAGGMTEKELGEIRQVISSAVSTNRVTLTYFPAGSNAPTDGATAEMWDQEYRPATVHNALNQAVRDATGYIFDPTEDISLHTGGKSRFDLVATLDMLKDVQFRTGMVAKTVVVPGEAWDESVAASFTVTQDDEARIFGLTSTKFVFTPGSNGDLASTDVFLNDLSGMTHIEFGIKADIAVAASDLVLRLSASINGGDTDKIIAIPALVAGVEQWIRVAMTKAVSGFTPAEATAIISVALEYNANNAANTIWMTGVDASQRDSYIWESEERHLWSVDKEAQDLVFAYTPKSYLMKLVGGDNPTLLTSDTDVTEIPEGYMIHYAVGTLLQRYNAGEDAEQARVRERLADRQMGMAERAKGAFPILVNARFAN